MATVSAVLMRGLAANCTGSGQRRRPGIVAEPTTVHACMPGCRHWHVRTGGQAPPYNCNASMALMRPADISSSGRTLAPNSWRQEGQAFFFALFTRS